MMRLLPYVEAGPVIDKERGTYARIRLYVSPADPTLAQLANGAPEPAMPAAAPAPAAPATGSGGNAVRVHVTVAPGLKASIRPTDTLFVLARDPQAQFAFTQFADAVKLTELAKNKVGAKGH